MILAIVVVAIYSPSFFTAAFNPIVLNIAVAALIGLVTRKFTPTATNCRRRPKKNGV